VRLGPNHSPCKQLPSYGQLTARQVRHRWSCQHATGGRPCIVCRKMRPPFAWTASVIFFQPTTCFVRIDAGSTQIAASADRNCRRLGDDQASLRCTLSILLGHQVAGNVARLFRPQPCPVAPSPLDVSDQASRPGLAKKSFCGRVCRHHGLPLRMNLAVLVCLKLKAVSTRSLERRQFDFPAKAQASVG